EELERKILVQHQDYVIQEKEECLILYFKDKDGALKEEIRSDELEEILEEGHKGHFGVQAAYDKLQPKYHFPHMWRTIKEYVESLCEVMGTRHSYTSAYHPQTNGLTEKFNGTLCNMLAKFVDEQGGSWDTWIPAALMCYRNKVHSSTKFTPALLRYGHNLETPFTLKRKSRDLNEPEGNVTPQDYVELLSNHHKRIYEIAKQNQDKAHEQQKKSYDKRIKQVSYKIGDKVLLYDSAKQNTKGDKFRK